MLHDFFANTAPHCYLIVNGQTIEKLTAVNILEL